jgi:hypothetical protein
MGKSAFGRLADLLALGLAVALVVGLYLTIPLALLFQQASLSRELGIAAALGALVLGELPVLLILARTCRPAAGPTKPRAARSASPNAATGARPTLALTMSGGLE